MRLRFVLALWLLATFAGQSFALDPNKAVTQYALQVWTSDDGLPQNSIYVILQTRDGYLWLGTEEGLARFDGVRFTVYDKRNTPQIKANQVNALLEDREGNLWIGTQGGGVVRLHNGEFTSYTTKQGLSNDDVWSFCEDRSGAIWIGTSGGLNRFQNGNLKIYTTRDGLLDETVWCLYLDRDGILWIGTSGGLNRYKDERFASYTTKEGLSNDTVISLCQDSSGSLWIGTSGGGVDRLQDGKLVTYSAKEGLANDTVVSLLQDGDGSLWIGTFGGVSRFRNGNFVNFTSAEGLSNEVVTSLYEDHEKSLWIGTQGGGLNRLQDGKFMDYTTREGLSNNTATSLIQDPDGSLWIGTYSGLDRLQNRKLSIFTVKEGLSNDNVRALYQDHAGTLWIGTYGGGLNRYRDGKFIAFTTKEGLSNDKVWSVTEDDEGNLWIGTSGGLNRYKDGKFTTFTTKDGLSNDHVWFLLPDHEGNLWIATFNGLNRLHRGRFTSFTTHNGLSSDNIISLYEDLEGSLWIGTQGGGLDRLKNGKIFRYATANGLFDDTVFEIIEDRKQNLWMSCNKGIFHVSKKELNEFDAGRRKWIHSISYGKADGMKSQECDTGSPAGCRTADGKLWFPTIEGVVMIDPENIRINRIPPPVIVESMIADGSTIPRQPGPNGVTLGPGKEKFEFHYTALSFLAPQKVRFRYRLEGFDTDWVDAGTRRTAYYTNIKPGAYTFRVKACNNDGIWNEAGASVAFILKPHFYQTVWFYLLCGLSLILLGWNLNRYRLGRVIAMERIRARIAADLHDDIGSGLSQISILSEVAQQNLANSGQTEPLMKIATTSRELLDSMSDIVWAVNPHRDHMADLVQRIRHFASEVLTARNIQFQFSASGMETAMKLNPDLRRHIYLIFKESVNNVVRHSECSKADISLTMDGGVFIMKVSDNGEGYDPAVMSDGHGLESMRERARKMGGSLAVNSKQGEGTTVMLRMPVGRRAKIDSGMLPRE